MIQYVRGNIFESDAAALVNTVNTVGVMGKGLALQFKKAFPNNFKAYQKACRENTVQVGKLFVTTDSNTTTGEKIIVNFPTKTHWKKPSEYQYVQDGLDDLVRVVQTLQIKSIAIPPLGAGNGGLKWERVKVMIETTLADLPVAITIYEPNARVQEQMKKERVKLTAARALLLYVLFDLVRNGEYVSEFSSEKVAYFLQRFGAENYLKLQFTPNFYGPYSGKVRFVLNALNGSYVMGYSDMSKKPFEPLTLVADGHKEVVEFVESQAELAAIAHKTSSFLQGFYSDFALELLSSVDFIAAKEQTQDQAIIAAKLEEWSNRKRTLFSDSRYLDIALAQLSRANFVS